MQRTKVTHEFEIDKVVRKENGEREIVTAIVNVDEYNTDKALSTFAKRYAGLTPVAVYKVEQLTEMSEADWEKYSSKVGEAKRTLIS